MPLAKNGARRDNRERHKTTLLAVDGGASKVDIAIVDATGRLLAAVRRPGSYHFGLDRESPIGTLAGALESVARPWADGAVQLADIGVYCLAGADIPVDDRRIAAQVGGRGWTARTVIRNDTFAVLRAGTDRTWGVALVCGTGMNCAGVGPDGRVVRFPSFGELSGDRAHGGGWLGRSALGVAVRARDGRGSRTALENLVPRHFGVSRPTDVMEAVYVGRLDGARLSELAPLVFKAARANDAVAKGLISELEDEIVVTVMAAIRRLSLTRRDVHVVLGGGVLRGAGQEMIDRIRDRIRAAAPAAVIRRLEAPPVLGAALIGLDGVGATAAARTRLRSELTDRRLAVGR